MTTGIGHRDRSEVACCSCSNPSRPVTAPSLIDDTRNSSQRVPAQPRAELWLVPWNPVSFGMRIRNFGPHFGPLNPGQLRSVLATTRMSGRLSQTQHVEARDQRGGFDPEYVRGPVRSVDSSVRELKRRAHVLPLPAPPLCLWYDCLQCPRRRLPGSGTGRFFRFRQRTVKPQHTAPRQQDRPLDDVLQFANVSRPRVCLKRFDRVRGQSEPTPAETPCRLVEEVRREAGISSAAPAAAAARSGTR